MEEMGVWRPPSKHLNNGLTLPSYGQTILPQAVSIQSVAPELALVHEDCK